MMENGSGDSKMAEQTLNTEQDFILRDKDIKTDYKFERR